MILLDVNEIIVIYIYISMGERECRERGGVTYRKIYKVQAFLIYMSKKAVMISIDEELHTKAKDRLLNISNVCEKALREKTEGSISDGEDSRRCFKCNVSGANLSEELVWLCPDERWICERCLKFEVRKVIVGVVPT